MSSRHTHSSEQMTASRNGGDSDAHKFDQFLKKLEVTKQVEVPSPLMNESRHRAYSSDNSFDSRNETAFNDFPEEDDHHNERQLFETRQCFVDRRVDGPACHDSVDSFIERAHSGESNIGRVQFSGEELELLNRNSDTEFFGEYQGRVAGKGANCQSECLLKLDRRDAIPTPRHKNDVLLEIEASTVDRRDFMVRPGVRCTESLPQGITTTGMDCIGRIVQLTTHARAIYGISIDDRVAAIYPFEYKDGFKDKGRRNKRYALADAGFLVTVPKHVDPAEASCMVRLYLSAFQSIQKGMSSLHDRYDFNQLKGQSILVQNGVTPLGRALIELAALLGASQIFATGSTEHHSLLMELGAIPLGSETFGWELFIEEKITLILVQDMPTPENFEQFISILDETKGNMVYIHHGHSHIDDQEDLLIADDITNVSCDGITIHELARKARTIMNCAKFSLRLACSPKYIVYEGVWPSCKGNPSQFKEDLRYLFTILGQGDLKPNVNECIGLEDVKGVQDRIELLGKKGTIVCLPTALYEKKISIVSPGNSRRRDQQGFPVVESDGNVFSHSGDPLHKYASDAGYVKATHAYDTLSDFHCMHDTKRHRQASGDISLPALPEATSYSHSNFNHRTSYGTLHNSSLMGSTNSSRRYSEGLQQQYYHNDASSMISSVGHSSGANVSTGRTALSDGALPTPRPLIEKDPPQSIQFRNNQTRRHRALRVRAKERWKKSHQPKRNTDDDKEQDQHPLAPPDLPDNSHSSQDKSFSSPTYSARKLRREARKREKKSVVTVSVMEENQVSKIIHVNAAHSEARLPKREQTSAAAVSVVEKNPVTRNIDAIQDTGTMVPKSDRRSDAERRPVSSCRSHDAQLKSDNIGLQDSIRDTDAREPKSDGRSDAERRLVSSDRSHDAQLKSDNIELQDSRNEDDVCARDNPTNTSSFNTIMDKWKNIDDMRRVMP